MLQTIASSSTTKDILEAKVNLMEAQTDLYADQQAYRIAILDLQNATGSDEFL